MTPEREKYIRACSSNEAYIRSEVAACAKEIKDLKKELSYNTARRKSIWNNNVVLNEHWKANAILLKIAKAKYKAIKKLLPKRKPAKKVKALNSEITGYWKFKRTSNGVKTGQCSICGGHVAGKSFKFIDNFYNFCPNCDNPMKPRRAEQ